MLIVTTRPSEFMQTNPNCKSVVAILLCTFNGAEYLRDQLDSFIAQSHQHWVIYASDDGSTDGTLDILSEYQSVLGDKLVILNGPRRGFARNFISLIQNPSVVGDYFAFSDQDDIWMKHKLVRGLTALQSASCALPALYCSRTRLIDASGKDLGFSPAWSRRASFRNALVQSLAGANTMLINQRTRELLCLTPSEARIVAHDWLTYLIVSGYKGVIVFDPVPTLFYRQHAGNLIGSNAGLRRRLKRQINAWRGHFSDWNEMNLIILQRHKSSLDRENRRLLECFELARKSPLLKRLRLLAEAGVYRQTLAGNLRLFVAAVLNKI
ncbi:TPA: glycosyltransferase family 2 protein [Pseudomonas putida]